MSLDEDIRRKLKLLRMSLRIATLKHDEEADKCRTLVEAINDFLGEPSTEPNGRSANEYGLVTDAVRSVLWGLKKSTFTVEHVERALLALPEQPVAAIRQTISIVLWKMADRNELEIVERGAGRKPSLYRVRQLAIVRHKRT